MKKKFINSSISLIQKNRTLSELDFKKLKYGLEGFYNLATKMIVMVILSIILNILFEFFLLVIIYSMFRLYGFGIHMKTSLQCWFTTVPIYIGGCLLMKHVIFPLYLSILLWIFGFVSFLLFAPADTPARPLIHKEKRIRAKILSLVIVSMSFFVYIIIPDLVIKNLILYGLLIESISINPLTYKLFKTEFNNYRNFKLV